MFRGGCGALHAQACLLYTSIPVLLVAAIESAITINMGIPYFTGTTLPFVASIVVGTIQLGATVDYAILITTRFREELNSCLLYTSRNNYPFKIHNS